MINNQKIKRSDATNPYPSPSKYKSLCDRKKTELYQTVDILRFQEMKGSSFVKSRINWVKFG
jgi:hypothetical protein